MSMRAGTLDRLISIQAKQTGKDTGGDVVLFWSEIAKTWARKVDLSGRELEAAMSISTEISTKFIVRYREDVTPGMRIDLKGVFYRIESALDKQGLRDELQIYCSTGLLDGDDEG